MYYLGLFFYSVLIVSPVLADPEADNVEAVVLDDKPMTEINICEQFSVDKTDELKLLIDGYADERFIKIIHLSRLVEKNHSLYLCEIDKLIDNCFKLNNQRSNLNNAIRLVKAIAWFGCSAGCAWMGYVAYNWQPDPSRKELLNLAFCMLGVSGSLFSLQSVTELKKIKNNYDQIQLYYKAIAMKNALLGYRKK